MKKIFTAMIGFGLAMAANSFAISLADTTILGKDYAKVTQCSDFNTVRDWTKNGKIANVIVMNDIDCGNAEFKPIGQSESKAFEGTFDGNGKTISGLKIVHNAQYGGCSRNGCPNEDSYAGLFGVIGKKGVVKNITINNSSVTAKSQYAGAVVGLNYGVVEGAKTTASVKVTSSKDPENVGGVGGIAGRNGGYGTMIGCENHATVSAVNMAGGIAGANTGAISNSINHAAVSGKIAGGIVGGSHYRTADSDITHVPGRIAVCQNLGSVNGSTYAGGIVGENKDGSINNCRNDGSVKGGIVGGVVGYTLFDNDGRYSSGNYTAVVLNSFSTTNSVTGTTVGGVVGKVENKNNKNANYSTVENCYYDSQVLSSVSKAVGSDDKKSTIETVKGETTANMNTNDDFVRVLNTQNGKIDYTFVWLFESGNYPVLDFTGCQGNYKITFVVNGKVTLEATTVKGKIVEATVADPTVPGAVFRGWKDDHGNVLTSAEAQTKFYTRAVTYNAVLNELFEITFVTSFGKELGKKSFEKGSMVFYYDEENDSEIPADLETDSATYKFTGWDRPFAAATQDTTYTAQFEKIAKTFTVKFFVQSVPFGETQTVAYGQNAEDPGVPFVEGFRFDGWDKEFTNVKDNLEIDAKLTAMTQICFVSIDTTKCDTVPVDTTIIIKEDPTSNDSLTCDAWLNGEVELHVGDELTVAQLTTLEAKCSVNMFDVIFYVQQKTYNEQKVAYGQNAEAPADPVVEGYRFDSWDKEFTNVKANLEINAKLVKTYDFCYYNLEDDQCKTVDEGTEVEVPEVPSSDSLTCDAWLNGEEVVTGSTIVVEGDITLAPRCEVRTFDVKFLVRDSVMNAQVVAYAAAAETPAAPVAGDVVAFEDGLFIFNSWIEDYSRVTDALDVNADISPAVEICYTALGDTTCDTTKVGDEIKVDTLPETVDTVCVDWLVADTVFVGETLVVGTEKVVFVADCHAKELNVKFLVRDSVVDNQVVAYNAAAQAPAAPVAGDVVVFEDGLFIFNNWIEDFSNVTDNLDVNADISPAVEICYTALGDTTCDTTKVGEEIKVDTLPESADTVCVDWLVADTVFVGETIVVGTEKVVFVADCRAKEFDVKFVAFDTVLVDSQRVAYGTAAVAPDSLVPVFEGYRFSDWDADFTYVESSMVVNAVFDTLVKVNISVDVAIGKIDTSFYVLKDTTFTGLKSMIDSLSGEFFVCEDITVNGEALTDTIVASEDLAVTATCVLMTHTITYYVDDKLIRTEVVGHGNNAKATEGPEVAGKRFVKWDKDLHNVVADIKTNGIYKDIEVDTIKVVANGKTIDSIIVAKGDSVEYKLPKIKDTKDSTFKGWKVGGEVLDAGEKIIVKFGDKKIIADFDSKTALRATRSIAAFSIHSENGQLQVIGARIGDELTVLDLQGRVIVKKPVQNSVELVSVANRGSFLVRVGAQTKRVTVR